MPLLSRGSSCYVGWMRETLVYDRVEAPTTDYLRDFALNHEKCKAIQFFLCRKIEIMRTTFDKIFLTLKKLWIFEAKICPNIIPMSRVCHNHWFLLTSALKTKTRVMTLLDMIFLKIQSQPGKKLVPCRLRT